MKGFNSTYGILEKAKIALTKIRLLVAGGGRKLTTKGHKNFWVMGMSLQQQWLLDFISPYIFVKAQNYIARRLYFTVYNQYHNRPDFEKETKRTRLSSGLD